MIDRGTLAGLLEHRHRLDAYCSRCDRWAELDLTAMVAAGLGDRRLPITVRCRGCGEVVRLQVRPPVLTRRPDRFRHSLGDLRAISDQSPKQKNPAMSRGQLMFPALLGQPRTGCPRGRKREFGGEGENRTPDLGVMNPSL